MPSISPKGSRSSTTSKTEAFAPPARPQGQASGNGAAATQSRPARRAPAEGRTRVAAIDVGSNSIRQLIADVSPAGEIRVIDEMKAAPRLGAGLGETGRLSEQAMRAATEAVVRMATLARQLGASRVEAVATSAVRDAVNARRFIEMVSQAAGLRLRVLNGADEARLSFRSALAHFDLGERRAVVVDIGGGLLRLAGRGRGRVPRP